MLEPKIGDHFTTKLSRDGKEMYKKRDARAELLLLLSDVAVAVAMVVS